MIDKCQVLLLNEELGFDGGIQFLYTIKMFKWNVEVFTEFQTATLSMALEYENFVIPLFVV